MNYASWWYELNSWRWYELWLLPHYSMIFGEPCSGNSYRKSWISKKPGTYGKVYRLSDESAEMLQKTADEIVGTKDQRMNFVFHSSNDSCEISPCLRAGWIWMENKK